METQRQVRITELMKRAEPLSERDKLRVICHVGQRTLQAVEDAGYRSVEDLAREDPDRLALKTGLGGKKAKAVRDGAQQFLQQELGEIVSARATSSASRASEAAAEAAAQAAAQSVDSTSVSVDELAP